jgi:hypothetical protein
MPDSQKQTLIRTIRHIGFRRDFKGSLITIKTLGTLFPRVPVIFVGRFFLIAGFIKYCYILIHKQINKGKGPNKH